MIVPSQCSISSTLPSHHRGCSWMPFYTSSDHLLLLPGSDSITICSMSTTDPYVSVFHFTSRLSSAKIRKHKLATKQGMIEQCFSRPSSTSFERKPGQAEHKGWCSCWSKPARHGVQPKKPRSCCLSVWVDKCVSIGHLEVPTGVHTMYV